MIFRTRQTSIRSIALPLASILVIALWRPEPTPADEGLRVGLKAPNFELPTIRGKTTALREFQNKKVVIVHFWKSK